MFKCLVKRSPVSKTFCRKYSSTRVDILPEIRSYMKPVVNQVLDSKDDEVLKKKLNFLGFKKCTRMNVAPKLLLEQLNGDNVFSIITKQLKDPWDYYWLNIRKNGNDVDKWHESMIELEKLNSPYQMDMCWMRMQGFVNPKVETFNLLLKMYAYYGRVHEFAYLFDDLRRCYQFGTANEESWNHYLRMFYNLRAFYYCDIVIKAIKGSKFNVDPELEAKIAEDRKTENREEYEAWLDDENRERPALLKYGEQYIAEKEKEIFGTLKQTIQPPLEWLVVEELSE